MMTVPSRPQRSLRHGERAHPTAGVRTLQPDGSVEHTRLRVQDQQRRSGCDADVEQPGATSSSRSPDSTKGHDEGSPAAIPSRDHDFTRFYLRQGGLIAADCVNHAPRLHVQPAGP